MDQRAGTWKRKMTKRKKNFNRENLKKTIRRQRNKDLPSEPKSLAELEDVPPMFTRTSDGSKFLIYD